jgi:hypothetical protein
MIQADLLQLAIKIRLFELACPERFERFFPFPVCADTRISQNTAFHHRKNSSALNN